jgi:hypothetical protein
MDYVFATSTSSDIAEYIRGMIEDYRVGDIVVTGKEGGEPVFGRIMKIFCTFDSENPRRRSGLQLEVHVGHPFFSPGTNRDRRR